MPWTWTMVHPTAFVPRTGVPDLLNKGYHHVTLFSYTTYMDEAGLALSAEFQKFLVKELGLAPKANLIGLSWGGFFSLRYANAYPQNVRKIYLDAPLLNLDGFGLGVGVWAKSKPAGGTITVDKRESFGHHPHGVDPDKTEVIQNFFK